MPHASKNKTSKDVEQSAPARADAIIQARRGDIYADDPQSSQATGSDPDQTPWDFLASHGGPFYELQRRLKLLHAHALNAGRRAVFFIAIAWAIPFFLALPGSLSVSDAGAYLRDLGVWATFFVAIGTFVLAERQVEDGLRTKLQHFLRAPIIAPVSMQSAAEAVLVALKQRDSGLAEIICVALAVVGGLFYCALLHHAPLTSWAVELAPNGSAISLAGWWSVAVSVPLFWFLMLRGLWRHFVWSQLLRKLARLELKLVATHPDGQGGLAFISEYPNAYMMYIFGVSAPVAVTLGRHFDMETLNAASLTATMAVWLVLVLALFAYSLSAFWKPLADLKAATILALSVQATHYQRLAERKVLGRNVAAHCDERSERKEDIADPSKHHELAKKLSTVLLSRKAVLPVGAAALLPFAIEGATRLPLKDVLSILKKMLLL